jgi:predicted Zn-dependent protease
MMPKLEFFMSVVRGTYHRVEGSLRPSPTGRAVCALSIPGLLVLVLTSQTALAFQRSGGGTTGNSRGGTAGPTGSTVTYAPYSPVWGSLPGNFPDSSDHPVTRDQASRLRHSTCDFDPYPTTTNTVSVDALRMPQKAQAEYQSACEAIAEKKLAKSAEHLQKALRAFASYARGWVTLGKVLILSQRLDEAEKACAQGATVDPKSWQAAICLSEIAGREKKWIESLAQSERALVLQPACKNYAYFFDAIALLHLNELPLAEQRALEAAQLDRDHQQPTLQLVLASIYESRGDDSDEANQLREFLKYAKDSPEIDHAKKELARLESGSN